MKRPPRPRVATVLALIVASSGCGAPRLDLQLRLPDGFAAEDVDVSVAGYLPSAGVDCAALREGRVSINSLAGALVFEAPASDAMGRLDVTGRKLLLATATRRTDGAVAAVGCLQVGSLRDDTRGELVLEPVLSGFGFSALVPDSRFALYALLDESLDHWNEQHLLWADTPGCSDAGPTSEQTRRIGEFWIPRGGRSGLISVGGAALAEFLRTDSNGLVSFLLVRETSESDPSGLAHGFASKEHPAALPPTLRLKLPPRL